MPYPDAANPDLLARIPLTATTVLDVGCGTGALGLAYKQRNPAGLYFGIEMDAQAAGIAATRLDRVIQRDIELDFAPFGRQTFDCIIYGDVLEHLRDPWGVLAKHTKLLSPSGIILICMPNIEHWSFAARLLRGNWDYTDSGLTDRSHLRWFSFATTRAAIEAAGLSPLDAIPRLFDLAATRNFVAIMAGALADMDIDPEEYYRRAAPLQYVWRATRAPVLRYNIISTMLAPVGGVSDVRVVQPMSALATEPDMLPIVTTGAEMPPLDAHSPKIFIFHRPLLAGAAGLTPIRQLVALGYVIVCEFDDHPDFLPALQRPDIQNFRAVHAVQTSTVPLGEVLCHENPEAVVFPNAIAALPPPRNFADPNRLTMFFGALNRSADWPDYVPALNAVARLAGPRLSFCIVHDQALFEALETPYKTFTPLCDYATYLDSLARCELSFMPLRDTPFNRCKSDLKFLEAAAHRVAALASPTVYGAAIEDGRTGIVLRNPADLQRRLLALVANPALALTIGEAAREHVSRHRMLASQIAARAAWYRSLWARRLELHEALLARVPELEGQEFGAPIPAAAPV